MEVAGVARGRRRVGAAVGSGLVLIRSVYSEVSMGGGRVEACDDAGNRVTEANPVLTTGIPMPWGQLALLSGGAVLAMLLVAAAGAAVLRGSVAAEEIRVA